MPLETLFLSDDSSLSFVGPSLDEGPLPSLFYFALSARDSLSLGPINHIVSLLSLYPLRIFSLDLPGHAPGDDPRDGMDHWANLLQRGEEFISAFSSRVEKALNFLFHRRCLIEGKVGVGGLSRGAFLAVHLGARLSLLNPILCFAPLTKLDQTPSMTHRGVVQEALKLNLENLPSSLLSQTLRLYIGNRDTLVGTMNCFHFFHALVETKFHAGHRSPEVEMILFPSVGNQGHGTPKSIFEEGAAWMATQLGCCV